MTFEELVSTLRLLLYVLFQTKSLGKFMPMEATVTNSRAHQIITTAAERCDCWPAKFEALLEENSVPLTSVPGDPNRQLSRNVKSLGRILAHQRQTNGGLAKPSVLRTAYANFVARHRGAVPRNWILHRFASIDSPYLRVQEAGLILKKDHRFVKEIAKKGLITTTSMPIGRREYQVVDRTSLMHYKNRYEQSLTRNAAADHLGVDRKLINQFVTFGLLTPLCGPGVSDRSEWRFDRDEVHGILENVVKRTLLTPERLVTDWIPVSSGVRFSRKAGFFHAQIIREIINGNLPAHLAKKPYGFRGLSIQKSKLLEIYHSNLDRDASSQYTATEAGRILGVRRGTVRLFARKGFLEASRRKGGPHTKEGSMNYAYCISPESISAFKLKYILPQELASSFNLHPRSLANFILLAGVQPLCTPHEGVNGTYLFFRQPVQEIGKNLITLEVVRKRMLQSARARARKQ